MNNYFPVTFKTDDIGIIFTYSLPELTHCSININACENTNDVDKNLSLSRESRTILGKVSSTPVPTRFDLLETHFFLLLEYNSDFGERIQRNVKNRIANNTNNTIQNDMKALVGEQNYVLTDYCQWMYEKTKTCKTFTIKDELMMTVWIWASSLMTYVLMQMYQKNKASDTKKKTYTYVSSPWAIDDDDDDDEDSIVMNKIPKETNESLTKRVRQAMALFSYLAAAGHREGDHKFSYSRHPCFQAFISKTLELVCCAICHLLQARCFVEKDEEMQMLPINFIANIQRANTIMDNASKIMRNKSGIATIPPPIFNAICHLHDKIHLYYTFYYSRYHVNSIDVAVSRKAYLLMLKVTEFQMMKDHKESMNQMLAAIEHCYPKLSVSGFLTNVTNSILSVGTFDRFSSNNTDSVKMVELKEMAQLAEAPIGDVRLISSTFPLSLIF